MWPLVLARPQPGPPHPPRPPWLGAAMTPWLSHVAPGRAEPGTHRRAGGSEAGAAEFYGEEQRANLACCCWHMIIRRFGSTSAQLFYLNILQE